MKTVFYYLIPLSVLAINSFAQSPTPSASVITPYTVTVPKLTTTDINSLGVGIKGSLVFDHTLNVLKYSDGTNWKTISTDNGGNYWTLTGTNLNSSYQSFSLLDGTNITPISGGAADDGTLKVFSPMPGPAFSGSQFITIDKNTIQARKNGIYPSYIKTEQNLRLNPFGGNVGIGTGTNPISSGLLVYKSSGGPDGSAAFKGSTYYSHFHYGTNEDTYIRGGKNVSNVILSDIETSGKVGIGVYPTTYKLEVKGTVRALEVLVETGWADYVFDEAYNLRSIDELEKFVVLNKHLPNVPKASEIETNGLKVGETSKAMMEKIEELTLYIIQLKKEIDVLKTKSENR